MGWKSTIDITRAEAKRLILQKLVNLDQMSNRELADMAEELGYGEEADLEYYGHRLCGNGRIDFIVLN
jgi:translation initiation factor 2 beta subunit (eIF-2beta)/eIF-5